LAQKEIDAVINNNGRLIAVGKHDEKFWHGGKALRDLSRDREFRRGKKFSATGRNSKEERLTTRRTIVSNTLAHSELQQASNND
jgi:hypothetical protein